METLTRQNNKPGDDYLASVTYTFWERAGCPQGQEMEFWHEAERYIISLRKAQDRKPGGRLLHHRVN
jgi:hypothetical protein